MDQSEESRFVVCCAALQSDAEAYRVIERLCTLDLDWEGIVQLASRNRAGPLLYRNLRSTGLSALVPTRAMRQLEKSYFQSLAHCTLGRNVAGQLLVRLGQDGIPVILLRGLALGETVYGDPALRPFSDIDLLIRKEDQSRAKAALFDLGYDLPLGSIDARYFERNHLHLQFTRDNLVVELHWALDHRFTVFDIDYGDIFSSAVGGQVAGVSAPLMPPENLLLSLCVHLVKHCTFSRYAPVNSDLAALIMDSGFLILYCDIDALVRQCGPTLDWETVVQKARRWHIESAMQSALAAVTELFKTPVPTVVLDSLRPSNIGWLERAILSSVVERAGYEPSADAHPPWLARRLLNVRTDLMFRPVRALDLLQYLWPPASFIAGRYAATSVVQVGLCRGVHTGRALGALLLNLADWIYYAGIKQRRP